MPTGESRLNAAQRDRLREWLPDGRVVADHSWNLMDTVVLEVVSDTGRWIVKASGPASQGSHHLDREIRAHHEWVAPWVGTGHAPALLSSDSTIKLLVTRYLDGDLVEGTAAQDDPDTYRQAGELLARLHQQTSQVDHTWGEALRTKIEGVLERPHRIDGALEPLIRAEVAGWPDGPARVVPTHGDWQPRNWLIDDGVVRVIDFGRAAMRPPTEDFVRLATQDFQRDPGLERAFLDGYGDDPREPETWRRDLLAAMISTAVWAYGAGDEPFEAFGHRQLGLLY